MSDLGVKIHISTEADLKEAEEAQRKLKELKQSEKDSNPSASSKPASARTSREDTKAAPSPGASTAKPGASDATSAAPAKERAEAEKTAARQMGEQSNRLGDIHKRIADLHRAADAYDKKPGMESAAESARSDARKLEREVARDAAKRTAEERASARARAAAEQEVTREIAAQRALRSAGIHRAGRAFAAGQGIATGGDTAASIGGTLLNAGMSSASPVGLVASIAAAVAVGFKGLVDRERDKDTVQNLQHGERRGMEAFRFARAGSVYGSSGDFVSEALGAEEERATRTLARGRLAEHAREKWYDPSSWRWGGLRKSAGQREEEVNEEEIIATRIREASAKRRGADLYMKTRGGLELESLRGRSSRSLEGKREAFVAEEAEGAFEKYTEAKRQGASDEMAKEMATLTYQNKLREMQATMGNSLIDSRSGAAGIATIAGWSQRSLPQESDIAGRLDTLINVVNHGYQSNQLVNQAK